MSQPIPRFDQVDVMFLTQVVPWLIMTFEDVRTVNLQVGFLNYNRTDVSQSINDSVGSILDF